MEAAPIIPDVEVPVARPRVTTTLTLRPLGPTTHMICTVCKEPRAHWTVTHARYGPQENICALCFLSDSGWLDAPENKTWVAQTVNVIGLKRGRSLERADGRLVQVTDADNVLGVITLHERFSGVTRRRA